MPLAAASCARCTQLETSSLALSLTCMPCCGPAHGMASERFQTGIHMPSQPGCPLTSKHISSLSCLRACVITASSIVLPSCRNKERMGAGDGRL